MEHRTRHRGREEQPALEGGFRLIAVVDLCRAWLCYREGRIRLYDLRLWLACQELVGRRCELPAGREARYTFEEAHRLVGGVGGEHLRAGLRRLTACNLVRWSAQAIDCSPTPKDTTGANEPALAAMLARVTNARRLVPVPRRMLRHLAGGGSRAVIAAVLGHLLRCLYGSRGGCRTVGACKASWVADTFGVDVRNVKAARQRLVALGWLKPLPAAQWYKNRFGCRIEINHRWAGPAPTPKAGRPPYTTGTPPPTGLSTTGTPPPVPNKYLLAEYKNQKPASRGRAGVSGREREEGTNAPTLDDLRIEDLRDTARLLRLLRLAVRRRFVGGGEHERLQFLAAAEHALAFGARNPPGLFLHLVRNRLWHFSTQADEDAARRRWGRFRDAARRGSSEPGGRRGARSGGSACSPLPDCVTGVLGAWLQRNASGCCLSRKDAA
jgi:hypothetical protein